MRESVIYQQWREEIYQEARTELTEEWREEIYQEARTELAEEFRREGIEIGRRETMNRIEQVAQNLLVSGMPLEQIATVTGLTIYRTNSKSARSPNS